MIKFNVFHTGAGGAAANDAQQQKVVMTVLYSLMKECNNMLTKALCLTLSTDDMSSDKHLIRFDFIKEPISSKVTVT